MDHLMGTGHFGVWRGDGGVLLGRQRECTILYLIAGMLERQMRVEMVILAPCNLISHKVVQYLCWNGLQTRVGAADGGR
jgi:hypothetical protein